MGTSPSLVAGVGTLVAVGAGESVGGNDVGSGVDLEPQPDAIRTAKSSPRQRKCFVLISPHKCW
jgi:hypothetical protein